VRSAASPMACRVTLRGRRGATHSTIPAANNGLDQQMPDASYFGSNLAAAVAAGNVTMARVNDMVARVLVPMAALGLLDNQPKGALSGGGGGGGGGGGVGNQWENRRVAPGDTPHGSPILPLPLRCDYPLRRHLCGFISSFPRRQR
jgi:beta-glucosidase